MSVQVGLSDGGRVSGHRDNWWLERRFAGWGGRGASRIHSCGEAMERRKAGRRAILAADSLFDNRWFRARGLGSHYFWGRVFMTVEFTWGKPLQTDRKSLVLGSVARMKRFSKA